MNHSSFCHHTPRHCNMHTVCTHTESLCDCTAHKYGEGHTSECAYKYTVSQCQCKSHWAYEAYINGCNAYICRACKDDPKVTESHISCINEYTTITNSNAPWDHVFQALAPCIHCHVWAHIHTHTHSYSWEPMLPSFLSVILSFWEFEMVIWEVLLWEFYINWKQGIKGGTWKGNPGEKPMLN